MRVLVTGASGFLGRHICAQLKDKNEVIALSRSGWGMDGVESVRGDVTDAESLKGPMEGCDYLIHAAGMVSNEPSDAAALYRIHVIGTETVLKVAKEAGVQRVVHLSTSGTVALSDDPDVGLMSEDFDARLDLVQDWPYYRTKLYAEELALAANTPEFQVVSVNPSLLLGPGDVKGESVKSIRMFLEGKVPMSPSGGISFVDVRDVAAVMETLLMSRAAAGRRYLLAGANMPFSAFYARLAQITDKPPPSMSAPRLATRVLEFFPSLGKQGLGFGFSSDRYDMLQASQFWYTDDTRARQELGFWTRDPNITLQETVVDILYMGGSRFAPPERIGLDG